MHPRRKLFPYLNKNDRDVSHSLNFGKKMDERELYGEVMADIYERIRAFRRGVAYDA